MKKIDIFLKICLVPIDFLICFFSFYLSFAIRQKININPEILGNLARSLQIDSFEPLPPISFYFSISICFSLIIIIVFSLLNLYRIKSAQNTIKELPKILIGVSLGVSTIILFSFLLRTFLLPRLIVLFFWIISIVLISFGHIASGLLKRFLYKYDLGLTSVVILGDNGLSKKIISMAKSLKTIGYKLYQNYSSDQIQNLLSEIKAKQFNQLIVADHCFSEEILNKLREKCVNSQIKYSYIPNLFEVSTSRVEINDIFGIPLVEVKTTPLDGWGRVIKRMIDLLFSALAIVILSPIYLIIALLIKIIIPGSVFFIHKRLGIEEKIIPIFKFRTMNLKWCDNITVNGKTGLERFNEYLDSHPKAYREWQEKQKLTHDPRISKFGKFLRKTNLDELPQFFNVFLGNLSLVGPRPIVSAEVSKYGKSQGRLFSIKPGLTGLWQVSGRNDLSYDDRVKLDIFYVENWSLWLDLVIFLKTVPTLFFSRGAY